MTEVKDRLADVEHALAERRLAREFLGTRRDARSAKEQVDKCQDMVDAAEKRLEASDKAAQRAIDSAAAK